MASSYRYPNSGKPEIVKLKAVGKIPSKEEAEKLTQIKYEKKPASAEEVKYALKYFFLLLGVSVALWFFGGWVIKKFVGPGVLFFGYGGRYLGAPIAVIGAFVFLSNLFRSARKKKPFDAMKWIWMTSLLGDDSIDTRFGKPAYALSTMKRLLPSAVSYEDDAISAYIEQTRNTISKAADITTSRVKEEQKDLLNAGPIKNIELKKEEEIMPGVKTLFATLSYKDCLSKSNGNNTSTSYICAELEIEIEQTYICAEGYWFPYDIMTPLEICEKIPESTEVTPSSESIE